MPRTVFTRPLRRLTQAELDSFLEKAADILRGNVDHSEFRGYVFALLFFKRISDVYQEEVRKLEAELGDPDLARDPKMHNFVVPEECVWSDPNSEKKGVARTPRNQLGTALNEAMIAIERANQPKFDGILTGGIDFNDAGKLPRDKLVNLINHFGKQTFDRAHVSDDVFGDAYEYLIRNFASKAGKSSGEFYTPREVAYLLAEIVEPQPGHSVCDWASGSGGLLLQCRNYLQRRGTDADRLFLHAQESNLSTYNISRINMILHGVKSWQHRHGDSLRNPRHLDDGNKMLKFDRIVMNPPFSLEDWGCEEFTGGDPHSRFDFGLPPRNNGDYAWLEHVVRSLKDEGKAIIVMSQGVLFRGQPEQTEEVDGTNQKADSEYVIREGFVKADLIECIIVLPSKLFYGNNVPACLIVLDKNKPRRRKNKILMIWASHHFQKSNPQNLLRPSDLMRILVPWRAFGDLDKAQQLVGEHEQKLIEEEEAERARRLKDIEDAYAPLIAVLPTLKEELERLDAAGWKQWSDEPDAGHPFFGSLRPLMQEIEEQASRIPNLGGDEAREVREKVKALKAQLREETNGAKREYKARVKELKRVIKDLDKLQAERDQAEGEVNEHADREISHVHESATDLLRVCSDPEEARHHFGVAERAEIEENEFNLNVPRYVETFQPEDEIPLEVAIESLRHATRNAEDARGKLEALLREVSHAD